MARVHHLKKGSGYGFHLASEKGCQFIRKIDPESPTEKSGIIDGDRLLGVIYGYIDFIG
jgi:Na(+)/H(+) exchange regulatory cofactor NHE-RF1